MTPKMTMESTKSDPATGAATGAATGTATGTALHAYQVTPADTLFVRGSAPFNTGESLRLESLFPPPPRTLQGAVRTAFLKSQGVDLSGGGDREKIKALVGPPERPCEPVQGPFLAIPSPSKTKDDMGEVSLELILPVPAYLRLEMDEQKKEWGFVPLRGPERTQGSMQGAAARSGVGGHANTSVRENSLLVPWDTNKRTHSPTFLPWTALRCLLWEQDTLQVDDAFGNDWSPLLEGTQRYWHWEPRTLIQMDANKGRPQESALVMTRHVRLASTVRFWLRTGFQLPEQTRILLGGERRQASIEKAPPSDAFTLPATAAKSIAREGRFWLTLVQPAHFRDGWRPEWLDATTLAGELRLNAPHCASASAQLTLRSALMAPAIELGGVDLTRGVPTPLRRYAAAGSAWLLEFSDSNDTSPAAISARATFLQALHGACALGDEHERWMGFGQVIVGRVPADSIPSHQG